MSHGGGGIDEELEGVDDEWICVFIDTLPCDMCLHRYTPLPLWQVIPVLCAGGCRFLPF